MVENREKFTKRFITKLYGKIPNEMLDIVIKELSIHVEDYDIEDRETALSPCTTLMMECYQAFIVSKKIEGISDNTLKTYNYYMQDFFKNIFKPLENISTNDIRIYLYNLQKRRNIGNRSLDSRRIVISSFFNYCVQEGYIQNNPCSKIGNIKFEQIPRKPLSDVEIELLRGACRTYREKAILEVFYSTGCRVTELINLNKSDVNFQDKEVYLFGKGNKHRTSYLNAKAEVALKKYLFTRTDSGDALFVTERKPYKRLSKNSVEAIIKMLGERGNLQRPIYPHLIRHTTATDALNRGMDVTMVQKLLGHSKIETTMIYSKINPEMVKHNHKKFII